MASEKVQIVDTGDNPLALAAARGIPAATNAVRNTGILHRSVIAAVDKLAVPGTLTLTAVTEAGSTLANTAYHVLVSGGNRWGPTGVGADPGAITPTANQAVRLAFTPNAANDYFDIFLSTATSPLWVARATLAQIQSGGFIVSSVGVVSAGGGAGANAIDLGIVGTGLASNVNPFASNNAYTPATPTPISCAGFSRAHVHVKAIVTDLRSLPTLTIVPFFQDQTSTADWFQGALSTVYLLTATGQALEQDFEIDVDGATNLVILIDTISGQGTTATVWVELA